MTRREARWAASAGVVMVVAGLVSLFGPWALVASGGLVLVLVLFVVDVEAVDQGEAVADPARQDRGGNPLHPGRIPG